MMRLINEKGEVTAKIGLAMKKIPPCQICGRQTPLMYGFYHPETDEVLASACQDHWFTHTSKIVLNTIKGR